MREGDVFVLLLLLLLLLEHKRCWACTQRADAASAAARRAQVIRGAMHGGGGKHAQTTGPNVLVAHVGACRSPGASCPPALLSCSWIRSAKLCPLMPLAACCSSGVALVGALGGALSGAAGSIHALAMRLPRSHRHMHALCLFSLPCLAEAPLSALPPCPWPPAEEGIEAVHLFSGRTVCRLHLPSPGLNADINGDGVRGLWGQQGAIVSLG